MSRTKRKHQFTDECSEVNFKKENLFCFEDVEWYRSLNRDGKTGLGSRKKEYKHLSKKSIRRAWAEIEHKIMKDEPYDHLYMDKVLGKRKAWYIF